MTLQRAANCPSGGTSQSFPTVGLPTKFTRTRFSTPRAARDTIRLWSSRGNNILNNTLNQDGINRKPVEKDIIFAICASPSACTTFSCRSCFARSTTNWALCASCWAVDKKQDSAITTESPADICLCKCIVIGQPRPILLDGQVMSSFVLLLFGQYFCRSYISYIRTRNCYYYRMCILRHCFETSHSSTVWSAHDRVTTEAD